MLLRGTPLRTRAASAFCATLLWLGCSPVGHDAPSAPETTAEPHGDPVPALARAALMAIDGPKDSVLVAQALARSLAQALSDRSLRTALAQRLRASRQREGKLHVQRFFARNGADLEAGVTRASAARRGAWLEVARRLGDLELYLPVPEHRARWTGSEEVIVVALQEDDEVIRARGNRYVGFNGRGEQVALAADSPPSVPVIVLTTAEDAFDASGESPEPQASSAKCADDACGGTGGGGALPPQVALTRIEILDDGEGWARGDPEITIAVQALDANGKYAIVPGACIHQDRGGDQRYDQNSRVWTGAARLIWADQLQSLRTQGRMPQVLAWEDDNGDKCDFTPETVSSVTADLLAVGSTTATLAGITGLLPGGSGVYTLAAILMSASSLFYIGSGDDYLGLSYLNRNLDPATNPKQLGRRKDGIVVSNGTMTFQVR